MTENQKTMARHDLLLAEMEILKSQVKLTPEERRKEAKRQMWVDLKAVEMERRQRVALEEMEKCKRDREERERPAKSQRQREKIRDESRQEGLEKQKQDQLKEERLRWESFVKKEIIRMPRYALSALKEEQEERREELRSVPMLGDKADPERLTSDLKSDEPRRKTLYNNWVGEEKVQPNSSVDLLFAAKPGPKPEEKPKTPKSKGAKQWMQDRPKVGHWGHTSQTSSLNEGYTGGFATSRYSILKSIF